VRVKILDQELELANHPAAIEALFSMIDEKLKDTGYALSSLIVDGVAIDTDYALYLSQWITEIQEIKVEVKSLRRLMVETMQTAVEYLERAQPEVERLGNDFYQGPTEDTWNKFSQLLEGLEWLLEAGTVIESFHPEQQIATRWGAQFKEKIKLLRDAMENSDHVLLGDLLQYEISPLFTALDEEIRKLLSTEGSNPSVIN